jgi:GNAT superfamily N-acetyltransferase
VPTPTAIEATRQAVTGLRNELRAEAGCQITQDSLLDRRGWTVPHLLRLDAATVGYAVIAIAGPWSGRRTLYHFYLRPAHRAWLSPLLEVFLAASRADSFEIQTNLPVMPEVISALGGKAETEAVIFGEAASTSLPSQGATLRRLTSERDVACFIKERTDSCDWKLELNGTEIGDGSLLFHYNPPYADIAMSIAEPFRRRGFGAYLVQELRREAHALGAIPAARSNRDNLPSHRTLQKAGFTKIGERVTGMIERPRAQL